MFIRPASPSDIPVISRLAAEIWWPTYGSILSAEQIVFMLGDMYSVDALTKQIDELDFMIAEREGAPVAFAAISETGHDSSTFKLHKLYLLPTEQGRGTGKNIMNHIEKLLRERGAAVLELKRASLKTPHGGSMKN